MMLETIMMNIISLFYLILRDHTCQLFLVSNFNIIRLVSLFVSLLIAHNEFIYPFIQSFNQSLLILHKSSEGDISRTTDATPHSLSVVTAKLIKNKFVSWHDVNPYVSTTTPSSSIINQLTNG